ncbi:hypothetical protein ABZ626_30670 [Streptomyces longispororuber]|uniref:hypothetical protein n=1 Tax=Streptomyces longispororuber TaxID=68230 RepID=UPI0033DBB2EF
MTGFLAAFGGRLAERWVALLAVPGLLYTATVAAALTCGWWRVDLVGAVGRHLDARLADAAVAPSLRTAASVAALLAGVLLLAAGAGLLARAVAVPVELACCGAWPRWAAPLARRLTERRGRRWGRADARVREESAPGPVHNELVAARNAIALMAPARPTWTGDRLAAAETRVWHEYGLDLASCWPRLWLVVPDTVQEALRTARDSFSSSLLTASWALLYLLPGLLWWPAALAAAVLALTARHRTRASAGALADLVEAVVDVHAPDLAAALKVDTPHHRVTPDIGRVITERLRKGV